MSRELMRHLHLGCGEALNTPLLPVLRALAQLDESRAKLRPKAKTQRESQGKGA